ncbi:MAG: YraN family protein [Candidatus Shapirobacteria bacterium]|nr:YraN family protein [Candidatus Shapirobacteria bacterium]MDD4410611.1 YraN family protein [Candidatus Shapirobacteria bacterium]
MYKKENYNKGKNGEEMAKNFLLKKGFELIEMNYENVIGEIDLIMIDKDWLVFVEVKLKVGDKFGNPEEMINKRKLSQIKRVAESYLVLENKIAKKFMKYRIDAVCIVLNEDQTVKTINYYDNLY